MLRRILRRIPGLRRAYLSGRRALHVAGSIRSPYLRFAPAGHFYSPLPRVAAGVDPLAADPVELPGIDLAEADQLAMLERMAPFHSDLPWSDEPVDGLRYCYTNSFFERNDVSVLFGMLRAFRPKRVIEVGSGWSSAAMLDARDRSPDLRPVFTFIEPNPERLLTLLRESDLESVEIITRPVQEVGPETFTALGAGDILFIDSSHVLKTGSDVAYLLFEVLPRLAPGVVVHIHDVFWPFDYPQSWYEEGRAWNEAFALRAFLVDNTAFRILYFNSFISRRHRSRLADALPTALADSGQSIWLQRQDG